VTPQLIAGAVIVAIAFAGGWQVNGWRLKASEARAEEAAEKAGAAATEAAVTAIKGIEVRYVPIRHKAEVITREVPVYRDCVHTDDGLRVVNEALTGQPADPASLSRPDPPH
jgi:hypothetical protein